MQVTQYQIIYNDFRCIFSQKPCKTLPLSTDDKKGHSRKGKANQTCSFKEGGSAEDVEGVEGKREICGVDSDANLTRCTR